MFILIHHIKKLALHNDMIKKVNKKHFDIKFFFAVMSLILLLLDDCLYQKDSKYAL